MADISRRKTRRVLPDHLNFGNPREKSLSSFPVDSTKASPEVETIPKHWATSSKGFPPGVTVDELKNYGRRKQLNHLRPQDNLRLEEGSLKFYKSEYKRRFLPFCLPKLLPSLEETESQNFISNYQNPYVNFPLKRSIILKPQNNLFIIKDQPMESLTEKNSKYIPFPHFERRKLLRRSTALKPEGEIADETEVRKEYKDYKNPEKAQLVRKLPSLKLEGEFEPLTTEQREKFIAFLLSRSPTLEKKKTSLRMEGNFDFLTEKNQSYVPHEFNEKPRIRKRSTSLKLEGEVEFSPEYRNSFVDFPRSRPVTYKPSGKIRHEGKFENQTETKTQFVNFENVLIPQSAKPENNLHIEGQMEISPEYRDSFVNFPRERPFVRRPFNQLKPEGNLELLTYDTVKHSDPGENEKLEALPSSKNSSNLEQTAADEINLKKTEISGAEETEEVISESKPEEEIYFSNTKSNENLFLEFEKNIQDHKSWQSREEKQVVYSPTFRQSCLSGKLDNHLKSPTTPRKKTPKEKTKLDFDEKKSNGEISGQSNTKRPKEARGTVKVATENRQKEKKRETHASKQNLRFSESFPGDSSIVPPKEFPAFKVLDVKGQMGCQTMAKDILESDKSTSDEETVTYRLEVFNPSQGSTGFYANNNRIFPDSALDSKTLEEAETRANQRAENYEKIVKNPEIPNCLLYENKDLDNRWRFSERSCRLSPEENLNQRSFVVLGEKKTMEPLETPRETSKREKGIWMVDSVDSQ